MSEPQMPQTSQTTGVPAGPTVGDPTVLVPKTQLDALINGLGGVGRQWANLTGVGFCFCFCAVLLYYLIDSNKFQQQQSLEQNRARMEEIYQRRKEHDQYVMLIEQNRQETMKARDEVREVQGKLLDMFLRNEKLMAMSEAARKDAISELTAISRDEGQKTREFMLKVDGRCESNQKEITATFKTLLEVIRKIETRTSPASRGESMPPSTD